MLYKNKFKIWFWPVNSNFHFEDCISEQTCENQLSDDIIPVLVVKEVIHIKIDQML
jgi:hypothetical protein